MKTSSAAAAIAGRQQRQRDAQQRLPPVGAEHLGCLAQARVKMRPKIADDAQHDGRIVEDMSGQDRPKGVDKLHRWATEVKPVHQEQVDPAARPEDGVERRRNHQRWQHKRDTGQSQDSDLPRNS